MRFNRKYDTNIDSYTYDKQDNKINKNLNLPF